MKKLFCCVLLIFVLFVAGCRNEYGTGNVERKSYESLIIGEWELYRYNYYDGRGGTCNDSYWVFNSDGLGYEYEGNDYVEYFNWRITGSKLTLLFNDGNINTWGITSLTDSRMSLKIYYDDEDDIDEEWMEYHFRKN